MEYGLANFLALAGSLGLFIYGMKIMSEGIQKAAGEKLRQILSAMTQNTFFGVLTGFLITAIIQSSSATTVMTVSFVNAGLLTLTESIGLIMGANLGTTSTAWLISLFGFGKISLSSLSLPIIAMGLPLLFSNYGKLKSVGEALIGFAILFMGLAAIKTHVPDLTNNAETLSFLGVFIQSGILSTILFAAVGAVITIIVQSSSAALALTLALLFNGVITFEIAAAMVLGENIGTTITANIAALVANVHAKRSARAHFIFNVLGVLWMILVFPWFIELVKNIWVPISNFAQWANIPIQNTSEELQLALFHTLFNLCNILILVSFIPSIVSLVIKMVPSKDTQDLSFKLEYLSSSVINIPELGLMEAKKEMVKFGLIVKSMSKYTRDLLLSSDSKKSQRLIKQIRNTEHLTDKLEEEVNQYLIKLSSTELSEITSKRVKGILSISHDLEDIADIYYQMSKDIERKNINKIWFTPKQRNRLLELFDIVDEAFDVMQKNLEASIGKVDLDLATKLEKTINKKRNDLRSEHLVHISKGDSNIKSGSIYSNLFSSTEKVGDHIFSINETLKHAF